MQHHLVLKSKQKSTSNVHRHQNHILNDETKALVQF